MKYEEEVTVTVGVGTYKGVTFKDRDSGKLDEYNINDLKWLSEKQTYTIKFWFNNNLKWGLTVTGAIEINISN